MKLFKKLKDGGPESPVDGYFVFEIKSVASIVLLKFNKGCRETFHSHAFNALTWFLKGSMIEEDITGATYQYKKSILPKVTKRSKMHRVRSSEDSWAISVRGPWVDTWKEYCEEKQVFTTLTNGRKIISQSTEIN
jgi:hypothetical protein